MEKKEFEILRYIAESTINITKKMIVENTGYSIEDIHTVIEKFLKLGLVDDSYHLTIEGAEALKPYKVENAIILAAGMSTRFVPVSYDLPKGLICVKGDVLIERQIQQLQQVGINEIVVVLGYMMEKFFYLREKYNVKIVVNNEYATKNTHSSVYVARDYLKRTYICCSDNYYPTNMFHKYEYQSYYCAEYYEGISYTERGLIYDDNQLIIDTEKPTKDKWIMVGHSYFDENFSKTFVPILEECYGKEGIENMYWEQIYAVNVDKLPLYIKKCQRGEVLEFDSMADLKKFDPDFITHNKVSVFENICRILCCEASDIHDIEPITGGLMNRSFKFVCGDKEYVYRHPGVAASGMVDRCKEAAALRFAKRQGVDRTLVYIDVEEGWKISKYVKQEESFDFANFEHISKLANVLQAMHKDNKTIGYSFDYEQEADKLIERLRFFDSVAFFHVDKERKKIVPFFKMLKENPWQVCLCHNDIYEPNILVGEEQIHLIDWEFAGDGDIGFDICKLFAISNPHYDELDQYLIYYFGRNTTKEEKLHLLACAAVLYYYWYIWGIYMSHTNENVSDYLLTWYDRMNLYESEVMKNL